MKTNSKQEARQETGAGAVNYFRATERLLFNYPRIQALIADEEAYCTLERKTKSHDIITFTHNASEYKPPELAEEQAQYEKLKSYMHTKKLFANLQMVISRFEGLPEFIVIRMYYFRENCKGEKQAEPHTWEEITTELDAAGILHDVKTARRWRTRLVQDMAVCIFGVYAAASNERERGRD
jgi:hypothetical protein